MSSNINFGFLEPPREYLLPSGSAWDVLRPLAKFLEASSCPLPHDNEAFRRAVDALNDADGESAASVTEDAIFDLNDADVAVVYSTLTLLCQKYVHGVASDLRHTIPRCLGRPWIRAAARRGSPLTLSYDGIVLANWRLRDATRPATLDNVDAFATVNGSEPEHAFVRVHVAIEAAGGDLPDLMLRIGDKIEVCSVADRPEKLAAFLSDCLARLGVMRDLIGAMYKQVSRHDFWKLVRGTLLGSPEEVFPNGISIETTDIILNRKGGSGAQSPLMHAVDAFFAVDHVDADTRKHELTDRQLLALRTLQAPPEHAKKFIREQVTFMCAKHREFHHQLEKATNARQLVQLYGDETCVDLYNACVGELEKWRKVHQRLAHKYIAAQAEEVELRRSAALSAASSPTLSRAVSSAALSRVQSSASLAMQMSPSASAGTFVDPAEAEGGMHVIGTDKGTQATNFKAMLAQLIVETRACRLVAAASSASACCARSPSLSLSRHASGLSLDIAPTFSAAASRAQSPRSAMRRNTSVNFDSSSHSGTPLQSPSSLGSPAGRLGGFPSPTMAGGGGGGLLTHVPSADPGLLQPQQQLTTCGDPLSAPAPHPALTEPNLARNPPCVVM